MEILKTVKNGSSLSKKLTKLSRVYQKASKVANKYLPLIPSLHKYNITVCHEKKFIWFRVAKVGTRTIFNELEKNQISLDAEHPLNVYYARGYFKDYFKFGFVRNPWDRLVSCWCNKVVDSNYYNFDEETLQKMQNFENFVEYVSSLDIENCEQHLRMQTSLIDLNNVDYIGRFETFHQDLCEVFERIGIKLTAVEKRNVSSKKQSYRNYYNDELREKVAQMYRKSIQIFSYKF